jgi:predicted MFS family arabinose efflux permease
MKGYLPLLRHAESRYLLCTSTLGRTAIAMSALAMLLAVEAYTGSYSVAGAAVGASAVAGAVAAPLIGVLIDRVGQTRPLVSIAIVNAGAWVAFLLVTSSGPPAAVPVVAAAAIGATRPPVDTCVRVLWPAVAPRGVSRDTAYALDAVLNEVNWIAGPLLVAATLAISPVAPALLCAGISLAGGLAFAAGRASRAWTGGGRSPAQGPPRSAALRSGGVRAIVATSALFGVYFGVAQIGIVALGQEHGTSQASGVLISLWCVGSLAGGLVYGARAWRSPPGRRYAACLLLLAATTVPLMLAGSFAVAIPLVILAGVAQAPTISTQSSLLNRLAPAGAMTEAFTWAAAAVTSGVAMGTAIAGTLVDSSGVATVFALSALAAFAATVVAVGRSARLHPDIPDRAVCLTCRPVDM